MNRPTFDVGRAAFHLYHCPVCSLSLLWIKAGENFDPIAEQVIAYCTD
jgi:hypothetical protein